VGVFVSASLFSDAANTPAGVVPWSTPERVATGFQFTEGPAWHRDGYLLFSDVQGNRIIKWTDQNQTETYRQPSGNSNGLAFDAQGRLVACEHLNRRISRTDLTGNVETLADRYQGKRLNSPNDLAIKSDGSIYFTDPPLGISSGQQELGFNGLFRISPEGDLTLLASDFGAQPSPNGLAFSPDETKLYVADPIDTNRGQVRAYDALPDGSLGAWQVFGEVPSTDGVKVDRNGRVYVAGRDGIAVFSPDGDNLGTITFPEQPSNCCFGGTDGKTLFVTARASLYRVRVNETEILIDSKGRLVIRWSSFPNRGYQILCSSDMLNWEVVADNVPSAAGCMTSWIDPTSPHVGFPRRFFYLK
jgi:YD repeat-containing protein